MLIRPPTVTQAPRTRRLEGPNSGGEAGGCCGLETRSRSCPGAPSGCSGGPGLGDER